MNVPGDDASEVVDKLNRMNSKNYSNVTIMPNAPSYVKGITLYDQTIFYAGRATKKTRAHSAPICSSPWVASGASV